MNKGKDVFTRMAELVAFVFVKPLTVVLAVNLKNLLPLPMTSG